TPVTPVTPITPVTLITPVLGGVLGANQMRTIRRTIDQATQADDSQFDPSLSNILPGIISENADNGENIEETWSDLNLGSNNVDQTETWSDIDLTKDSLRVELNNEGEPNLNAGEVFRGENDNQAEAQNS